jgi:hypothetical protein
VVLSQVEIFWSEESNPKWKHSNHLAVALYRDRSKERES